MIPTGLAAFAVVGAFTVGVIIGYYAKVAMRFGDKENKDDS